MKTNQIIATVILLIVFSATSFFVGTKYQQKKTVSRFTQQIGTNRAANNGQQNRGQTAGFRQTIGDIISTDDKSITVKMTDGSSKIVLISDTTSINQSTVAAKTDLKVGAKVAVLGDQNTDGSITGRTINLNPTVPNISPAVKK
jgi:hypothetical protein